MEIDVSKLLERIRKFSMPDGEIRGRQVRLRQVGELRLSPERPWRPFRAHQVFNGSSLDFRWQAWMKLVPLLPTRVVDAFEGRRGHLTVSMLGFIPIVRAHGPDINKGEVLRSLAELPWRPFAIRESPQLNWNAISEDCLQVTCDDGQTRAEIVLSVDAQGGIRGGEAMRPRRDGNRVEELMWSGTYSSYRVFGSVTIPTVAEVLWMLPSGPFAYYRAQVIEYAIDP